jgi:hypothetical protein
MDRLPPAESARAWAMEQALLGKKTDLGHRQILVPKLPPLARRLRKAS